MFYSNFSFTMFSLMIFPLFSKIFTSVLIIYETTKIHNKIPTYNKMLVLTITIYQCSAKKVLFCCIRCCFYSLQQTLHTYRILIYFKEIIQNWSTWKSVLRSSVKRCPLGQNLKFSKKCFRTNFKVTSKKGNLISLCTHFQKFIALKKNHRN